MSRRLSLIGILLIVLVCSMSTVFAAEMNKTTQYQSKLGYKLEYPADWIGIGGDKGTVVAFKPKSEPESMSNANIYIMAKDASGMTLNGLEELNLNILRKSIPEFKLIRSESCLLSNKPGRAFSFSGKRGVNFQGLQFFTIQNNKAYIVTYTYNTKSGTYHEAAKKIIGSFTIN